MLTGYVPGGFDMLHIGHLNILSSAAARCDRLIVGVATDDSLERMKGRAPIVPQASPSRCILKAKRESARRDAWTWPTCEATLPFIGYIGPWQPAHQKVASSGRRAVAAMQSPAHAACATGLEKTTASGLMSAVSVSSCHRGSTSVI